MNNSRNSSSNRDCWSLREKGRKEGTGRESNMQSIDRLEGRDATVTAARSCTYRSALLCSALNSSSSSNSSSGALLTSIDDRPSTRRLTTFSLTILQLFSTFLGLSRCTVPVPVPVQRGGEGGGRRVSLSRSRECENRSTIPPSTNSPEPAASTELEKDLEIKRNLLSRNSEPIPYSLNSPRTTRSLLFHQKEGEKKRSGPLAGWRAAKQ